MKAKKWELAILVSNEGFDGIQLLNYSPETRSGIMAVLPRLRDAFRGLDETIKKIREEKKGETENLYRAQPSGA